MDWLGVGVLLAVTAGAAVQIITGTGFALVCAPFLLLILGHDAGVRAVLLLSLALNAFLLAVTFRHTRWKDALLLLLPALALVVPTVFLVDALRGPTLTIVAGAVIVAATVLVARGYAPKFVDSAGGVLVVGAVSGIFTVVAAVSGPPVTLLAVQRRWSPNVTRGTMQAFFLPLNVAALLALGPSEVDLSASGWALAGCLIGLVLGVAGTRRIPAQAVKWTMLSVAAAGGVWLVANGTLVALSQATTEAANL